MVARDDVQDAQVLCKDRESEMTRIELPTRGFSDEGTTGTAGH